MPRTGEVTNTRQVIIAAGYDALTRYGLAKLSLGDVARHAGLSRQTVYRYFRTREELIVTAMLQELHEVVRQVDDAVSMHDDLRGAIEALFRCVLELAERHELLNRLLKDEPEAILPYLTTESSGVLAAAVPILQAMAAERVRGVPTDDLRRFADTAIRLLVSHMVYRSSEPAAAVASRVAGLLVDGFQPARAEVEG
ncbi:MAG: TetR family transcriptional regulator [Acidimicrobiales bacterium]